MTDVETGAPIPGAVVSILDAPGGQRANFGLAGTADIGGRYAIHNVTIGNANNSATATGYAERRIGFNISGDTIFNWQLRKIQPPIHFGGLLETSGICIGFVPGLQFRCIVPFHMRRHGTVDVTVNWTPVLGHPDVSVFVSVAGSSNSGTSGTVSIRWDATGPISVNDLPIDTEVTIGTRTPAQQSIPFTGTITIQD